MSVVVYPNAARAAARHVDTRGRVRKERGSVTRRARTNLEQANKTSRVTDKGYFPATITEDEEIVDDHEHCFTILTAPNATALEYGHNPSGVFAGTETKPPAAEYILTKAAIGGAVS